MFDVSVGENNAKSFKDYEVVNLYDTQAGMIIFFEWADDGLDEGGDHTGIVEKVEGGKVYTIEGNSSDACQENSYSIGHYEILGCGAPAY